MLSKSQIKLITQLNQKKYRLRHQLFVAEGVKTINELLKSDYKLHHLYTLTNNFDVSDDKITIITPNDLKKISFLKTPQIAVAIFKMKDPDPVDYAKLVVALDDVRDPGNLGTIIRLCDWFGVQDLLCSLETVDCFNPKVVQATMGSLARVNISYLELNKTLGSHTQSINYGTFMDGENIYEASLTNSGVLILGNEANGISQNIAQIISKRIAIPRFGNIQETESLNVANAAAILLSEFKRRSIGM